MAKGIIVCGLNGAGKSTLARALAEELNYRFIDIEDIYFPKNNPDYLYADPRPFDDVQSILLDVLSENTNFVLASVRGNFKKEIVSHFVCAVYIEVPKEIRLKRVYERSFSKFGNRMYKGGDLFEREQSFFKLVESRDENTVNDWLSTVQIPIIKVDGTLPIVDNVKLIATELNHKLKFKEIT